jgi:hypothetical protein
MLALEKLKRNLIVKAADEPFQIINLIPSIETYYHFKNENEKNVKILEIIKYFLEEDILQVGKDYNFEKWDLSLYNTLLKIKSMLDSGENLFYKVFFDLTVKGRQEALTYFEKQEAVQGKVLLACQDTFLGLDKVIEFIKETFSNDPEEIEFEFRDIILSLLDWKFIEIGNLVDNKFEPWEYFLKHTREKIKIFKLTDNNKNIYFQITPKGQLVLDEWKKSGGRISDHFNKIIFQFMEKVGDYL